MTKESPPCRLLELPPELRNAIFSLVLECHSHTSFDANATHLTNQILTLNRRANKVGLSPNLLLTCQQIHKEATPMLYGTNRLIFNYRPGTLGSQFLLFINRIGSSVQFLRNVELRGENKKKDATAIFVALRKARVFPTTFSLGYRYHELFTPEKLALALGPLVRFGDKQHKSIGNEHTVPVVGRLKFSPRWIMSEEHFKTLSDEDTFHVRQAKMIKDADDYGVKVKAALRKMLG